MRAILSEILANRVSRVVAIIFLQIASLLMIVAAACITLIIPENDSLKGKRKVVKSLIDKVRHKFEVAIAEVGDNDLWQKARIGVAVVGNDSQLLNTRLRQIMKFVENQYLVEIIDSQVELCYLEK
jgi:uncharacterized protein